MSRRYHNGLKETFPCSVPGCKALFIRSQRATVNIARRNSSILPGSKAHLAWFKRHIFAHTKGKIQMPLLWQGASYRSPATHERSHTGEKSYGCFVCRRKFYDLANLKGHFARHSLDEFKYVCDRTNCGSRYISQEGLQRHVLEHTTGKAPTSYSCQHCAANFDLEIEFFKHLARKHDQTTSLRENRKKTFLYVN